MSAVKILTFGIIIILGIATALNYFLNAGSKPKIIKFIAAHDPYEIILKPLKDFKAEVEKNSNGRVRVELIIPEGTDTVNIERAEEALVAVQKGEYQMGQLYAFNMTRFEKDFMVLEVPFLFRDHEHSFATVDGEIGKELLAKLERKSSLKGLGFTYSGGYRIINTKNKIISKIKDFEGLKIATGDAMNTAIFKELGVNAIQGLQKGEIREQVTVGSLEGMISVYPRYFYNNDYKVAPITNELFFNIQFTVLTMNKGFFYSLSAEDQKIVELAAQNASLAERNVAIEIAETIHKNASQHGITIANMEPKEKKMLIEKLTNINWEKKFNLSSNLIERIKNISNARVAKISKDQ